MSGCSDIISTTLTKNRRVISRRANVDPTPRAISITYEDPSSVYPSPNSSAPTAFSLLAGSTNQFITVGTSMLPIAGYQFALNAPSSAGAKVNFVALQAGIG
jgi:hypothetical protein